MALRPQLLRVSALVGLLLATLFGTPGLGLAAPEATPAPARLDLVVVVDRSLVTAQTLDPEGRRYQAVRDLLIALQGRLPLRVAFVGAGDPQVVPAVLLPWTGIPTDPAEAGAVLEQQVWPVLDPEGDDHALLDLNHAVRAGIGPLIAGRSDDGRLAVVFAAAAVTDVIRTKGRDSALDLPEWLRDKVPEAAWRSQVNDVAWAAFLQEDLRGLLDAGAEVIFLALPGRSGGAEDIAGALGEAGQVQALDPPLDLAGVLADLWPAHGPTSPLAWSRTFAAGEIPDEFRVLVLPGTRGIRIGAVASTDTVRVEMLTAGNDRSPENEGALYLEGGKAASTAYLLSPTPGPHVLRVHAVGNAAVTLDFRADLDLGCSLAGPAAGSDLVRGASMTVSAVVVQAGGEPCDLGAEWLAPACRGELRCTDPWGQEHVAETSGSRVDQVLAIEGAPLSAARVTASARFSLDLAGIWEPAPVEFDESAILLEAPGFGWSGAVRERAIRFLAADGLPLPLDETGTAQLVLAPDWLAPPAALEQRFRTEVELFAGESCQVHGQLAGGPQAGPIALEAVQYAPGARTGLSEGTLSLRRHGVLARSVELPSVLVTVRIAGGGEIHRELKVRVRPAPGPWTAGACALGLVLLAWALLLVRRKLQEAASRKRLAALDDADYVVFVDDLARGTATPSGSPQS